MSQEKSITIRKLEFINANIASLNLKKLNIIAGDNNTGKTTLLKDIVGIAIKGNWQGEIVKDLKLENLPVRLDQVLACLQSRRVYGLTHPQKGGYVVMPETYHRSTNLKFHDLQSITTHSQNQKDTAKLLVPLFTLHATVENRLELICPDFGNLLCGHLRKLHNKEIIDQVNEIAQKVFGIHLRMDHEYNLSYSYGGEDDFRSIANAGSGIKAFMGIIVALYTFPQSIIVIDEPEVYLSPHNVRTLGQEIAKISKERDVTLMISTHSADFLMGCLEEYYEELQIIRLERNNESFAVYNIADEKIEHLYKNPSMRNTAALKGLFHKAVVITEGHDDRTFYEEIYRSLCIKKNVINNFLFLDSGGGKNGTYKFSQTLKALNLSVVIIMDLDFITDSEKTWKNFMGMEPDFEELLKLKEKCCEEFKATDIQKFSQITKSDKVMQALTKLVNSNGVSALANQENISNLLSRLNSKGIFLVPYGELECWAESLLEKQETWKEKKWDLINTIIDEGDIEEFFDKIINFINRKSSLIEYQENSTANSSNL